jgi:hypothetical protein
VAEERRPERRLVVGVDAPLGVLERAALAAHDHEILEAGNLALAAVDAAGYDGPGARGESACDRWVQRTALR